MTEPLRILWHVWTYSCRISSKLDSVACDISKANVALITQTNFSAGRSSSSSKSTARNFHSPLSSYSATSWSLWYSDTQLLTCLAHLPQSALSARKNTDEHSSSTSLLNSRDAVSSRGLSSVVIIPSQLPKVKAKNYSVSPALSVTFKKLLRPSLQLWLALASICTTIFKTSIVIRGRFVLSDMTSQLFINRLAVCIGHLVLLLSFRARVSFGGKFATSVVCGLRVWPLQNYRLFDVGFPDHHGPGTLTPCRRPCLHPQ